MKVSELVVRCLLFCCGLLGIVFALFLSPMMFVAWFCSRKRSADITSLEKSAEAKDDLT